MLNLMAGSLGGVYPPVSPEKLAVVSIVTSAVCNLKCRHCYLENDEQPIGMASEERLQFLESLLADLRPEAICFSGKEVFALPETARLLFNAIRLRDQLQADGGVRTRIGVITNGTLVGRYRDRFADTSPDWLDLSIDGTPDRHDAIRGKGAFDKMARNLPWLLELLGDRLWITPTLMESNIDALPEMVAFLYGEFGLRRFSTGLYKPQTYTDALLRLQDVGRESRILRALRGLADIGPVDDVEVKLEFDSSDDALRTRLEDEGLIPREGILRVSRTHLGNGVTLGFATTAAKVGLWRAVRVTNEGLWLAAEDLVDAQGYKQRAIGHLADFDFDARRAYEAGLVHPRFEELFGTTADEFLRTVTHNC